MGVVIVGQEKDIFSCRFLACFRGSWKVLLALARQSVTLYMLEDRGRRDTSKEIQKQIN